MFIIKISTFLLLIFFQLIFLPTTRSEQYLDLIYTFLLTTGILLQFWFYTTKWDKIPFGKSCLFPQKNIRKYFLIGLLIGVGLFLIPKVLDVILFTTEIDLKPLLQPRIYLFMLVLIVAQFLSAFSQELVFRGYVLNQLTPKIGTHLSSILVAILFWVMHLPSPDETGLFQITTLLGGGLFLNYAFLASKNIYFPIGIHFSWNLMTYVIKSKEIFEIKIFGTSALAVNSVEIMVLLSSVGVLLWYSKLWRHR